jgi:hypothetical protein
MTTFTPQAWQPLPAPPLTHDLEKNDILASVSLWMTPAMPDTLKPKPARHGIVLGYDTDGVLVHNLQDSTGRVAITTSARYHDGRLFIGSLMEPHIAVHEL